MMKTLMLFSVYNIKNNKNEQITLDLYQCNILIYLIFQFKKIYHNM